VDKIFGPGNQFVTAAKMMMQNSEAMVGHPPHAARLQPRFTPLASTA